MAEWPNPVPPIPLLRLGYPKFNSGSAPILSIAIFTLCSVATPLWVEMVIPQTDRLVLKVIRTFRPSFLSYESVTSPQTERQAVEKIVLRVSLIIGHLLLLWPLLNMSLRSVMEGTLWATSMNALQYATYLGVLFESFMVVNLLFYYGDMAKIALMLDETRQIELVNLTNGLWRDREGERRSLGYSQYGYRVTFSSKPESWFRSRAYSTVDHPYTHFRQFMLDFMVSTSAFLAVRSSSMTCMRSDGIWGLCEPLYGLGLPLITNVLILAHKLVSYWWVARRAKNRSNEFTRPPRMCRRDLKGWANYRSYFEEHDQRRKLAHDFHNQKGGLFWGCPWRPTVEQVKYWLFVAC